MSDKWWSEMCRSSGAISAMLTELSPKELESVAGWAQHLLKSKWYLKRWKKGKQKNERTI